MSCAIALHSAVNHKNDVSLHWLNPATNNRIKMIPTDPDTGPVDRGNLVKGYEFRKGHYAVVTQEELKSVHLQTTGTLDIETFVSASEIDRLYWDVPYYVFPADDGAIDAYSVIRDALARTGRIALGRVVMHTRERVMALEPSGKGLVCTSLRTASEIIPREEAFESIPNHRVDAKMIDIAEKIIDQSSGPFDPQTFSDRYEDALRDLVKRKQRGDTIEAVMPEKSNVIDLMDALKRSLSSKSSATQKKSKRGNARGTG